MIETSLGLPGKSLVICGNLWKSLEIIRNFWKMFGNIGASFRQVLENLRKVVGYLSKIVKNPVISMS